MQLSNSFAIIVLVHTSIKVHGTILLQNAYSNKRNAIMVHQHDIFDIDCFSNLSHYYQCLFFQLTIKIVGTDVSYYFLNGECCIRSIVSSEEQCPVFLRDILSTVYSM